MESINRNITELVGVMDPCIPKYGIEGPFKNQFNMDFCSTITHLADQVFNIGWSDGSLPSHKEGGDPFHLIKNDIIFHFSSSSTTNHLYNIGWSDEPWFAAVKGTSRVLYNNLVIS